MGIVQRVSSWIRSLGRKETIIRRYPLPPSAPPKGQEITVSGKCACRTQDDVVVRLDSLVLSVQRKIDLDIPFEVSVIVPRAEISETYSSQGKLVQRTIVYSSITIAHSPRFEGLRE